MESKKQESVGKSGSGSTSSSSTPSFLIRFHANRDELQVEEVLKPSASSTDKCDEQESQGSSESASTCSSPVSAQDVEPGHNRDSSPIKDYLSRFKRSITVDSCSPVSAVEQSPAGGDNRNYFSDFKERLAKRVEEIRNDRLQKLNKLSKDSSFSDVDSDILTPELSPTVKTSRNPLSHSCSDINSTDETKSVPVTNEDFSKSKQIEKLTIYLDNKLSNQEGLKSSTPTLKTEENKEKKKDSKKLTDKPVKGGKKLFKKTISDLKKSDPSIKSYFSNRKSSYLSKGVVDAEKVEEAEEATDHYKMNQAEVLQQNRSVEKVQRRRKIGVLESLALVVNWWKALFGLIIFFIIHHNAPGYVSAFFAGFFLSMEFRSVINLFLKKLGFKSMICGDDKIFYTAYLNEGGIPLLSDSAIFNSPPEKIVHQDWMNEMINADDSSDSFRLSQTEPVYVHLDGPLLFISTPRFKIPKRAVWSEPQYKMLFNEKRMYLITNCSVDLVPEGLIRKRKWSRRFPLRIKLLPHSFIGACIRGNGESTIDENATWVPASDYVRRSVSDFSLILPADTQSDSVVNEDQSEETKVVASKGDTENVKSSNEAREESIVTRDQLDQNERYLRDQADKQNSKQEKQGASKTKSSSEDDMNDPIDEESLSSESLDHSDFSLASSSTNRLNDNNDSDFVHIESSQLEDESVTAQLSKEQALLCGKKQLMSSEKDSPSMEMPYNNSKIGTFPAFHKLVEDHIQEDASSKEEDFYLYLFCRTNRQKEAWFSYLSAATKFKIRHGEIKTEDYETLKDPVDLRDSSEVPLAARKSKYLNYMYNLQQNVVPKIHIDVSTKDASSEPEVETQLMWLNAIIGRVTHEFSKNQFILNFIKKKIQQKLGLISLPRFMDALNISNLEIDDVYPVIKRAGHPTLDDRGIWVDLEVVYSGSSKIAIDTKLNLLKLKKPHTKSVISESMTNLSSLDTPSSPEKEAESSSRRSAAFHSDVESESSGNSSDEDPLLEVTLNEDQPKRETASATKQRSQKNTGQKVLQFVDKFTSTKIFESLIENKYVKKVVQNVSNTDLSLMVELKWLCGTLVINIPPPPIDRIWIGFRDNPKMVLSCYPRFGETEVSYMEVSKWIRKLLIREMEKNLVLPNMEDILLPTELL